MPRQTGRAARRLRFGPMADADSFAYLRPETAQGIFLNFKNVVDTTRVKVPFGVAMAVTVVLYTVGQAWGVV